MTASPGSRLRACLVVTITFFLSLMVENCRAIPLFMVTSGKGKCVTVVVPEGTDLRIKYEAPDLVLDNSDPSYGPVWIGATDRPTRRARDYDMASADWKNKRKKLAKLKPTSHQLTQKSGEVVHEVQLDGEVDVCVRASPASTKNPMRFGLLIEKVIYQDPPKQEDPEQSATNRELSRMEAETTRLTQKMEQILQEADYAKEREMVFHNQSLSMNAATMWWPIVQLSVLLVTGFTQASHIIRFFKSRHII